LVAIEILAVKDTSDIASTIAPHLDQHQVHLDLLAPRVAQAPAWSFPQAHCWPQQSQQVPEPAVPELPLHPLSQHPRLAHFRR